jgi:hypothetical protein
MNLTFTCKRCKKDQSIIIADPSAYDRWKKAHDAKLPGNYIQNILPELTPDEREMLVSGVCGTCFDEMFKEKD